jgi:hypothetical protein
VLLNEGLVIESFGEQRTLPWRALPGLQPSGDAGGAFDGAYVLDDRPERLPLTFSIAARAPGGRG